MKHMRWLAALMGITIFAITGFQAYWLKKNYEREERSLEMKTNVTFRRTVQKLQASKFNFAVTGDSALQPSMITVRDSEVPLRVKTAPKEDVLEMIGALRERVHDTVNFRNNSTQKVSFEFETRDSGHRRVEGRRRDKMFQIFYQVDSLQRDSVTINEIKSAYAQNIQKEKVDVPFSISRIEGARDSEEPVFNEVTLGFSKPVTYRLDLGNTFPFLLQRLTTPILFSIFLVGVTILSFVLLYRNLLKQRKLALIKNEFISNITHELKTPIATVGVAIEALRSFNAIDNPARTKEYLDISASELQRLSLLVDKVLKLSMFENKEIDLKYEPVNMRNVVDEVANSMRLQFEKQNANLQISESGDVNLKGDRLHLLSVIYNLFDNALKYSNGAPTVNVQLAGSDKTVQVSVSDNGIGIPKEYRDKIFEKFFRVPTGNRHNAKGYGLGLSYTAHVVQQHRGQISVDSTPSEGSAFTITLPKES